MNANFFPLGIDDQNEILVAFDDGKLTLAISKFVLTIGREFRCCWVDSEINFQRLSAYFLLEQRSWLMIGSPILRKTSLPRISG